ncbi:iron-containing redox enzyme family protein [Actimicrobium antarcticum]|uniref:Iron-containing redox enzyme family protein n=1 Tax=Actimicrobium antarcticum TaxID=1051899 RepID=A0ABP7TIW5_9BURK
MSITLTSSYQDAFHRNLAHFNVSRIALDSPSAGWQDALHNDLGYRLAEGHYLEELRATVVPMMCTDWRDTDGFADWFEALLHIGPGQQHPLFDWLADAATMSQMRWFLTQEVAGEAGFDDLVAMTQVKLPVRAKLECARNYWDEMGHGKQSAMHGHMLERMVQELGLQPSLDATVWESLALSNTMIGLAMTRRYTYHAIGALGAIELTAPLRVKKISNGMRRLGLDGRARAYFDLHAALDVSHAKAWIREIIRPLVDADPSCAQYIAEGAMMRLLCGERCFNRYQLELDDLHGCEPASVLQPLAERHLVRSC